MELNLIDSFIVLLEKPCNEIIHTKNKRSLLFLKSNIGIYNNCAMNKN